MFQTTQGRVKPLTCDLRHRSCDIQSSALECIPGDEVRHCVPTCVCYSISLPCSYVLLRHIVDKLASHGWGNPVVGVSGYTLEQYESPYLCEMLF